MRKGLVMSTQNRIKVIFQDLPPIPLKGEVPLYSWVKFEASGFALSLEQR